MSDNAGESVSDEARKSESDEAKKAVNDEAEPSIPEEADELPPAIRQGVPDWDNEYLNEVSARLLYNYDLQKDYRLRGERWDLYGEMRVLNQKQFFHPALNYANHEAEEYLFVNQIDEPTVVDLNRLVDLGHDLADERIEVDEEHYRTDLTFILVANEITDDVHDYVDGFRDRTLLKFGYYGHYDVNLVVIVPDAEECVASEAADVVAAFQLWDTLSEPDEGFLSRFAKRFWR